LAAGGTDQGRRQLEREAEYSPLSNAEVFGMSSWHGLGDVYIYLSFLVFSGQFPVSFCHKELHQGNYLTASVEKNTCCATRVAK
jgi:hypothetical protein